MADMVLAARRRARNSHRDRPSTPHHVAACTPGRPSRPRPHAEMGLLKNCQVLGTRGPRIMDAERESQKQHSCNAADHRASRTPPPRASTQAHALGRGAHTTPRGETSWWSRLASRVPLVTRPSLEPTPSLSPHRGEADRKRAHKAGLSSEPQASSSGVRSGCEG